MTLDQHIEQRRYALEWEIAALEIQVAKYNQEIAVIHGRLEELSMVADLDLADHAPLQIGIAADPKPKRRNLRAGVLQAIREAGVDGISADALMLTLGAKRISVTSATDWHRERSGIIERDGRWYESRHPAPPSPELAALAAHFHREPAGEIIDGQPHLTAGARLALPEAGESDRDPAATSTAPEPTGVRNLFPPTDSASTDRDGQAAD